MKTSTLILTMLVAACFITVAVEAKATHCTWHGTAPTCAPSCPSGKFAIKENRCGKAKIACCILGKKKLCCPDTPAFRAMDPSVAEAMAH